MASSAETFYAGSLVDDPNESLLRPGSPETKGYGGLSVKASSPGPTSKRVTPSSHSRAVSEELQYETETTGLFYALRQTLGIESRHAKQHEEAGIRTVKAAAFESNDFEDFISPIQLAFAATSWTRFSWRLTAAIRWLLNFASGFLTALIAVFIIYSTRFLTSWKFSILTSFISAGGDGDEDDDPAVFSALGSSIGISVLYGLGATVLVIFVEPLSASSGIPEIKAYLNGIHMPRILRIKTMLCKVFGVIMSVSSGMPCGYEGPMVAIGSAIGSAVSQGKSFVCGCDTRGLVLSALRNNKERRDFAVCGASAGIASAFNAPIGGVLFVMEEASSHWHRSLTWRAIFTSMTSAYAIGFILSGLSEGGSWGQLSKTGMFSFGDFASSSSDYRWSIWELPAFIAVGALGGIFGVLFNFFNGRLALFRSRSVTGKTKRICEVLALAALSAIVSFLVPYYFGSCFAVPDATQYPSYAPYESTLVRMFCKKGQYNDLASLWLTSSEDAIRQLFHMPGNGAFSLPALAGFFVLYTVLMCVCSGLAMPSGLFIPSILAGSAMGRIVGELLDTYTTLDIDSGTYALIGGAAMVGGLTRMTISLTVILLECTGNYTFGLPILLALMSARFIGNFFNSGIYDQTIEIRKWPLLDEKLPKRFANSLRVSDVMTKAPLVFREVEQVGRLYDVLCSCSHNGFAVVYSEAMMTAHPRLGTLAGYIQRKHLAVLLARRAFHKDLPGQPWQHPQQQQQQDGSGGSGSDSDAAADPASAGTASGHGASSAHGQIDGKPPPSPARPGRDRGSYSALSAGHSGNGNGDGSGGVKRSSSGLLSRIFAAANRQRRSSSGYNADRDAWDRGNQEYDRDEAGGGVNGGVPRTYSGSGSGKAHPNPLNRSASRTDVRIRLPSVFEGHTLASEMFGPERERSNAGTPPSVPSEHRDRAQGGDSRPQRSRSNSNGLPAAAARAPPRDAKQAALQPATASHNPHGPGYRDASLPSWDVDAALHASVLEAAMTGIADDYRIRFRDDANGNKRASGHHRSSSAEHRPHRQLKFEEPRTASEDSNIAAIQSAVTGRASGTFRPVRMPSTDRKGTHASSAPSATAKTSSGAAGGHSISGESFPPLLAPLPAGGGSTSIGTTAGIASLPLPSHRSTSSEAEAAALASAQIQSTLLYQAMYENRREYVYASEPLLQWADFERHYPRYPDVSAMVLSEEERDMYIDLRPYMDPSPVTVHVHAPISRAFRIFKGLGLRHLIAINDCSDVVGLVTRHELATEALNEHLDRVQREQDEADDDAKHDSDEDGGNDGTGDGRHRGFGGNGAVNADGSRWSADNSRRTSDIDKGGHHHQVSAAAGSAFKPSAAAVSRNRDHHVHHHRHHQHTSTPAAGREGYQQIGDVPGRNAHPDRRRASGTGVRHSGSDNTF